MKVMLFLGGVMLAMLMTGCSYGPGLVTGVAILESFHIIFKLTININKFKT